jgi:hypothetical protein
MGWSTQRREENRNDLGRIYGTAGCLRLNIEIPRCVGKGTVGRIKNRDRCRALLNGMLVGNETGKRTQFDARTILGSMAGAPSRCSQVRSR